MKRFTIYNPIKRRSESKSFSLNQYDEHEINELFEEWKQKKQQEFSQYKMNINKKSPIETLKKFKLDIDKDLGGCSIAIYGATKSGKTYAMKYILDEYFKKYINIFMSNSLHNKTYDKMINKMVTSESFQNELISDCYHINKGTKNHYDFNVILDDIVDEKNDDELKKLLTIYRNSNVSCILTAQVTTLLNPTCRANINFVLFFKLGNDEQIEKCIKSYLNSYMPSRCKTMLEKIQEYKKLTEDHHFIMLDNLKGEIYRSKIN